MTGMEIGPAIGVAAKGAGAAGKALGGSDAEKALIREIAKDSPGAQVAGGAMGDRMAAKQLTINRLLAPLFWFAGYRRDYFESGAFAEEMAAKMDAVPQDDIISPAPNVAAQAMEGLSYSLDEPELREMYLNLLATASDNGRASSAHPSYAAVIRQLSAEEAALLPRFLVQRGGAPIARVVANAKVSERGYQVLVRHVADLRSDETDEPLVVSDWPIYVDNWVRLGLVEADYTSWLVAEHTYDYVQARPEYTSHKLDPDGDFELGTTQGLLKPTDFGIRFGRAVQPPPHRPVDAKAE